LDDVFPTVAKLSKKLDKVAKASGGGQEGDDSASGQRLLGEDSGEHSSDHDGESENSSDGESYNPPSSPALGSREILPGGRSRAGRPTSPTTPTRVAPGAPAPLIDHVIIRAVLPRGVHGRSCHNPPSAPEKTRLNQPISVTEFYLSKTEIKASTQ
jgi:hypothetical protein